MFPRRSRSQSPPKLSPKIEDKTSSVDVKNFESTKLFSTPVSDVKYSNRTKFSGKFLDSIPSFSGATNDITFEEFYYRVNLIAEHEGWSEEDILLVIRLKLTDAAARFLRENPSLKHEMRLEIVTKALKDRFSSPEYVHTNLRTLLQSYQRPNESVREYASRVEAASYKTIPTDLINNKVANAHRLDVLTSVFIDGLKPSIRRFVLPQNHKDFDSARRHAISEEEIWTKQHTDSFEDVKVMHNSHSAELAEVVKTQQQSISALTDGMAALQMQMKELLDSHKQTNDKNDPPNRPISPRCYYCNRLGHIAKNCSMLRRDRPRSAQECVPPPGGAHPFAFYGGYGLFQHKKN